MCKFIFFAIVIILMVAGICSGQSLDGFNTIKADANACELNSLEIDIIRSRVGNTKQRVFVIARAGNHESESVNLKRLLKEKEFLVKSKGWSALDVIYARREKASGEGRIEFYVGADLRLVILAKKNRAPCMACCDDDYLSSSTSLLPRKK